MISHLFFFELDIHVTHQMVTKIVAHVHLFNLEGKVFVDGHFTLYGLQKSQPGRIYPRTPRRRPRRSCRSAPASPRWSHWPDGSRQPSWPSSGGWCRGWREAQSGRRSACCGSCCSDHRGCMLLRPWNKMRLNGGAEMWFFFTCFEEKRAIHFVFFCPKNTCQILSHFQSKSKNRKSANNPSDWCFFLMVNGRAS